jgi:peptidoglycan hydrolase CwlO-like protein
MPKPRKLAILENTEEKKKYQKNLLNVEKEISRLDNKIKEIEIQMGDPEFL